MSERLTVKQSGVYFYDVDDMNVGDKLGQLEDIMEKHGFESVEDLEDTIKKVDGLIIKATQSKRLNKELEKAKHQIRSLEEQLKNAIVPKFKIGQEVWVVDSVFNGGVIQANINSICISKGEICYTSSAPLPYYLYEENIFATREEAEARLAELEGK